MNRKISCLVADDHPAMIEAVCDVLEEHGIEIIGRARDGDEALQKLETRKPDRGARRPADATTLGNRAGAPRDPQHARHGGDPLHGPRRARAAHRGARRRSPGLPAEGGAALRSRARGRDGAAGQTYVDPGLAGVLASSDAAAKVTKLTQRERDVLRLLADGLTNEEIGKRLFISPETVRTHVRKAMDKLDADTRTQAVATALRQSLIA